MNDQTSPATALLAAVREASSGAKLKPLSELVGLSEIQPQGSEGTPLSAEEIEACIAEAAEDDIKLMRGNRDIYYFSETFMTPAYALHLFRVMEKDPARMVADTIRDESRIYPRPTPSYMFLESPFNMTEAQLDGVLWQISQRNDMADIKRTTVSNGALYLYSTLHLTDLHAETLAEWNEVGQAENP